MNPESFKNAKHIYFIGIGGIGMSAVARMFLFEGREVSGSDLSASLVTDELEKHGANIRVGEPASSGELPAGTDLVIYTVAIPETHPEFVYAKANGLPVLSYPETLALISEDKFTIAVAGTHGKTTTTAMIAKILIDAQLDPTVIVGSFLIDQKSNFIAGKSKYFIVEACEYKRSFLNLRPNIAVITNIDDDHLDYYKNMAGIQKGFSEFAGLIKKNGLLVTDVESSNIIPVLDQAQDFFNEKNITVSDYPTAPVAGSIRLRVPGKHNVHNAKAALAVARALEIPEEKAIQSLENFAGTWRRFEFKGETATGVLVYDDYGHHPSEISATLAAAREKFPTQKIVVVFQPHLYSRTKEHVHEFGSAFGAADTVVLLPIYAAREPADSSISSQILVEEIKKTSSRNKDSVIFAENFPNAALEAQKNLSKGDVIIVMGAGDVGSVADLVINR